MKKLIFIIGWLIIQCPVSLSQEIKIMAWNIFMVPPVVFKSCQSERAFLIADYIKNINPDIIVLEETFMKDTRAIIYDKLKQLFPFQSAVTKKGFLKANSGIWIFSKYPLEKQDFITYKKKKGSDIFARKGATFIELKVNNKKIQIVGTHTQSLPEYKQTRMVQFQQLKTEMLEKYLTDSVPQFIIGDLNCNYYDTTEYNNMLQLLDVLPASFSGEKYSWNGLENDLAFKFSEHTLETLDYTLLRKQHGAIAKITNSEILKPYSDTCFCNKKFNYLSDHNPLLTTIILK
jgi:endonuclease/exonuclease/phosphatase family metal-dependent hydrolase